MSSTKLDLIHLNMSIVHFIYINKFCFNSKMQPIQGKNWKGNANDGKTDADKVFKNAPKLQKLHLGYIDR